MQGLCHYCHLLTLRSSLENTVVIVDIFIALLLDKKHLWGGGGEKFDKKKHKTVEHFLSYPGLKLNTQKWQINKNGSSCIVVVTIIIMIYIVVVTITIIINLQTCRSL